MIATCKKIKNAIVVATFVVIQMKSYAKGHSLWDFKEQWTYSVTFATDIEFGLQIFWTVNCRAFSQWKIVCPVAAIFFFLNNFLLGNGSAIQGSKNLNATFNVGGKSKWVRLISFIFLPSLYNMQYYFAKYESRCSVWRTYSKPLVIAILTVILTLFL